MLPKSLTTLSHHPETKDHLNITSPISKHRFDNSKTPSLWHAVKSTLLTLLVKSFLQKPFNTIGNNLELQRKGVRFLATHLRTTIMYYEQFKVLFCGGFCTDFLVCNKWTQLCVLRSYPNKQKSGENTTNPSLVHHCNLVDEWMKKSVPNVERASKLLK